MKQAHTLREYQYYDKDTLCSIIDADFTTKQVRVENKVDSILDTAFGVNTEPTWDDFLEFLASRCIPKTRCGLGYYLDAVGVPEYDPVQNRNSGALSRPSILNTVGMQPVNSKK